MVGLANPNRRPAMHLIALARWLARKAVVAEWKARIAEATKVYLMEHRNELIKEAWEHPVAQEYRHQERMRLARKAVIAEIRERGGKVNSIAPEELRKLVKAYLEEHPWDGVIREIGC